MNKDETTVETPPENAEVKPAMTKPDDLAADLIGSMPKPTPPPPAEQTELDSDGFPPDPNEPKPPTNNGAQIRDNEGKVFNPEIHASNADGSPKLKDGKFTGKRGRKPGQKNGAKITVADAQNNTGVPDEYDRAAEMYFDMGTGLAVSVISDEWNPEDTSERAGMVKAIAAYLRAKGQIDLSPGQALAIAGIAYGLKRANKPKTKERFTLWFLKARELFNKWFKKNPQIPPP